ncbi:hypothetical protein CEP54_003945 [Fusarium duplospermum]|uniref:Uncharacterized protein n=1 Tax=Fusarium duplospermum TaxID=1325734 RepID=A0A428QLK0_9HYPO|nr:hypothetical protein CEP54_003945 [Fusarium duplospermum]
MISRAARVPRICLACRFGLTQRSAVLGFRAAPITHTLGQRRRYTSEIGKTGDGKIETFITGANTPAEKKPKEEEESPDQTETTTKSEDTASDIKSSSEAESTSDAAPPPQDDQDVKPISDTQSATPPAESSLEEPINPVQETRDEPTSEAAPVPEDNQDVTSVSNTQYESPTESSSENPINSEQETQDQAATQAFALDFPELFLNPSEENSDSSAEQPTNSSEDSMFELPVLPELEEPTGLPTKRFRHDLVHDESLGVSALGVPADAIIINNPNQIRRSKKAPTVVKSQPVQPPSEFDWKRLTPQEIEDELGDEDIYRNIDDLRPDTRFLRDSEIEKLTDVLRNGFTTDQLREYVRLRKAVVAPEDDINYPWIKEHLIWTPLKEVTLRGQDKAACVNKIIYDKWKIQSQKHVDDLGRVMVQIKLDFFKFLTFESDRMVRELREDFLVSEEETITINRQTKRVNIVAKKATAYGVIAHLDQIFQKRVSRDIPIRQHVALIPSLTELEVLSQITKTTLKVLQNKELRVSWLPGTQENAANSKTEDLGDVVFRLLLGQPKPGHTIHLECLPRPQTKGIPEDHFLNIRRQLKTLSWREKLQEWQRVVAPVNKSDEESPTPLDLVGSATLPEYSPEEPNYRNVTTATFGYILHNKSQVGKLQSVETKKKLAQPRNADSTHDLIIPLRPDDLISDDLAQSKMPISGEVLSHKRRAFSPLIPHPASFSALKPENSGILTQSTAIILNLSVHGDRSTVNKLGPAIQVRLPVDAEADLANYSIPKVAAAYCVVPWFRNELMLPGESVDVRIQHERILPLDLPQSGLKKFLAASEFNLLQGHLRTPSQAILKLPPKYINPIKPTLRPQEHTYTFRGLEIHQTVEMPWRGHTLRYSSIEAGQHGGQRQELTLQAGRPNDLGTSFKGEKSKSFLQLVEDMATGKCFSWADGYKSIKSRQLEDHSYDLPEEELTEDILVDGVRSPNLRRSKEPEQPKKRDMPRRETRATPTRQRKLGARRERKQPREMSGSKVTKPKTKAPEAEEPEISEFDVKEPEVDQASVGKPDVAAEETKEPDVDQTSAKKPQRGGKDTKSTTGLLHSFLDQFADANSLKAPTDSPHADVAALTNNLLQKEATKSNASQTQETPKPQQAISEDVFESKFAARKDTAPPKAPSPVQKSKKGTAKKGNTRQSTAKKQPATPSHASQFKDPFAAAFASRLSTNQQHTSSSGGDGFFDTPKGAADNKGAAGKGKRRRKFWYKGQK